MKKIFKTIVRLVIGLLVAYFAAIAIYVNFIYEPKALTAEERAQNAAASSARVAADRIDRQFKKWNGAHVNLEKFIKKSMNDPDSYEHVETKYWKRDDHLIVQMTFRGKNAFGGIVKNSVKAKVSLDGQILEIIE